ncbi:MAG: PEP/pyruvate-binding domain-containing protein [Desulfobulbaceae bacterium]
MSFLKLFSRSPKGPSLRAVFGHFRKILTINNQVLAKMAQMEEARGGEFIFDRAFLRSSVADLAVLVRQDIYHLNAMTGGRFADLFDRFEEIQDRLAKLLEGRPEIEAEQLVLPYEVLNRDMDEFVGAKNANLAEAGNMLSLRIPRGFALTTRAYISFLEANDLPRRIAGMVGLPVEEKALRIAGFFVEDNMPSQLRTAIEEQVARLGGDPEQRFAVRSSAVGEDADRSFAGQFVSFLDVPARDVPRRCLDVMASRFSEQLLRGVGEDALSWEFPMAVGVQTMIDAAAGGVIYTRDPTGGERETMIISAAEGGSRGLVSGRVDSDQYNVERRPPFVLQRTIIGTTPAHRRHPLHLEESGMFRGSALLRPDQLRSLAETGLLLEKHFGRPQDIEWIIDGEGRITVVQCRRLYIGETVIPDLEKIRSELAATPVLLQDCGHPAQLGVACGEVVEVDSRNPPPDFPVGAVAVCRTADPMLSIIVPRAAAILTEVGSPTGHLASITREYGTPALFGCGRELRALKEGMLVTVDVEERIVYEGCMESLDQLRHLETAPLADAAEMRVLRRMLRLITPLNLTDVTGVDAHACRTLHDIIRFCHEKAVATLIDLQAEGKGHGPGNPVLELPLPLRIRLVDLGDALREDHGKEVEVEDIVCRPLQALIQGMLMRGMWENEPVSLGIRDLLSGALRTPHLGQGGDLYTGENLAIIAPEYVNLSLRLGYHFNVIDSYIGSEPMNNYIYFRFVGGMAEEARRARRAELISIILHSLHFLTERRGDVVTGKAKMLTPEQADEILGRIGQLIAFTRQLDVRMVQDEAIDEFMEKFLEYTSRAEERE